MKTPRRSFLGLLAGALALPKFPLEAKPIHLGTMASRLHADSLTNEVWMLEPIEGIGAILRHISGPSNPTFGIVNRGVDLIYSMDDLAEEITNPGFWTYPCPPRMVEKMRRQVPWRGFLREDMIWGWRKLPWQEDLNQITTEYVLARWSRLLYSPR